MGALLNRAEQTISYYKNGIELGTAFQQVMEERLYPCVGMQTQDEEVRPEGDTNILCQTSGLLETSSILAGGSHAMQFSASF
jgi:hypothetical protein